MSDLTTVNPHTMQQATHPRLHLRDAHDAHVVFEAVRQGFLSPVSRRLNEMERNNLVRSGAIFVWFEAEDDSGLMRWTGRPFRNINSNSIVESLNKKMVGLGAKAVCGRCVHVNLFNVSY